jgi:aspartyl/asparaginyl beta-hydroxylase (cupin superfamily)
LERARRVTDANSEALALHLETALAGAREALPSAVVERWDEAAAIMAGLSRPFVSESNQLHVPRLPAIPFFDRSTFPWAAALEARTAAIRAELEAVMRERSEAFTPYIAYRPGDPVNQWRELNHSPRWSSFHLWRGGEPVAENLERCPETARALGAVEMADIGGLCPNAMFSVLAPHTAIPPHTGETNARLVAHLPLIVPPGCAYRVGYENRAWREGELLIFDDTIEHEARNDSDQPRVVLIFDIWNPLLQPAERRMVQTMSAAARSFAVQS